MIDLHSHILPDLDDGASDLSETLAMVRIAVDDGITRIVGTPHYDGREEGYPDLVAARLALVRQEVARARLPIEVLGGFELLLSPQLAERALSGATLGINGGRYLLVEVTLRLWPPYVFDVLFRLQSRGFLPILAHAERYRAIIADGQLATRLVHQGILLQINGSSLLGFGDPQLVRCARQLVKGGLVSLLASDAHSPRQRVPRLHAAADVATRLIGPAAAELLVEGNPAAVIADAALPAPRPLRVRRHFFAPLARFRRRG